MPVVKYAINLWYGIMRMLGDVGAVRSNQDFIYDVTLFFKHLIRI